MSEDQVKIINWLYNFCSNIMEQATDIFPTEEAEKLKEEIEKAFPEHSELILKSVGK